MFEWLFGKKKVGVTRPSLKRVDRSAIPLPGRDWKAAEDNELSEQHWGRATDQGINTLLALHLNKLIARSSYEARANPIVDGTITSHATDIVGPDGPGIEFQTDNESFNREAEQLWKEIASQIDGSGELTLAELLRQDIRSLWTTGAILSQYVTDAAASTLVKQRLHPIPVQCLYSGRRNTDDTMLGITRNKLGRPTRYHIIESGLSIDAYSFKIDAKEVPASDIQHVYIKHEPQQWRGYPWLASALQALAELDDYDTAVLDAAKVAAMMAVLFYSTKDDIETEDKPEPFRILRQTGVKVPAGWQPFALNSNQPTDTHQEFKQDKIRDIGRPVGMPLMSIQRDASNHNYSSARFDGQGYARANESIQSFLAKKRIEPFMMIVLQEAMLRKIISYQDPRIIKEKWVWRWTKPPHVDPVKEAMAQRLRMENRTLSPQGACLENNVDFETICRDWKKANEILKANGLPEMLGPIPSDPAVLNAVLASEDKKDGQSKSKPK